MNQVKGKIADPRVLELITKFLTAGHINPNTKVLEKSNTGVPQGGILSPLLCNIVMHMFDEYVMNFANTYTKGTKRRHNPAYQKLERQRRLSTNTMERLKLLRKMQLIRNVDTQDPNFRRLRYIRYADDFVIMTIGTRNEAEMIKLNCKDVLKNKCGVELNESKTIITHMKEGKFKFLGAEIVKLERDPTFFGNGKSATKRVVVRRPLIKAPIEALIQKLKSGGFIRQNDKKLFIPQYLGALINLSHYDILSYYNSRIHGILNYYSFASNLNKLGRII